MATIFISYSHKDRSWKDRLAKHLNATNAGGAAALSVWEDGRIAAGGDWLGDITQAIDECQVAILLVSADFLTSSFVLGTEVPALLARRAGRGLRLVPLIVHDCAWRRVGWLAALQARPMDGKALSLLTKAKAESALAQLATEIAAAGDPAPSPRVPPLALTAAPGAASAEREAALQLRMEAELHDLLLSHRPGSALNARIEQIVKAKYAPLGAFYEAVDARVEHELAPLIKDVVDLEAGLRTKHRLPFTQASLDVLRQRIKALAARRWQDILDHAALDAENHVFHNLGMYPRYKQEEIRKLYDAQLASADYRGVLDFAEGLLKKAYADAVLNGPA